MRGRRARAQRVDRVVDEQAVADGLLALGRAGLVLEVGLHVVAQLLHLLRRDEAVVERADELLEPVLVRAVRLEQQLEARGALLLVALRGGALLESLGVRLGLLDARAQALEQAGDPLARGRDALLLLGDLLGLEVAHVHDLAAVEVGEAAARRAAAAVVELVLHGHEVAVVLPGLDLRLQAAEFLVRLLELLERVDAARVHHHGRLAAAALDVRVDARGLDALLVRQRGRHLEGRVQLVELPPQLLYLLDRLARLLVLAAQDVRHCRGEEGERSSCPKPFRYPTYVSEFSRADRGHA